jgi:hypothetical protein
MSIAIPIRNQKSKAEASYKKTIRETSSEKGNNHEEGCEKEIPPQQEKPLLAPLIAIVQKPIEEKEERNKPPDAPVCTAIFRNVLWACQSCNSLYCKYISGYFLTKLGGPNKIEGRKPFSRHIKTPINLDEESSGK